LNLLTTQPYFSAPDLCQEKGFNTALYSLD